MQIAKLIEKIKSKSIDADAAGRAYFSVNTSAEETCAFLDAYLEERRYEELAAALHAGFINKEYSNAGYLLNRVGSLHLDARYFSLLLETASASGYPEEKLAPLFAACFAAPPGSFLAAWRKPAEAYLVSEAYRDYGRVLNLLTAFDPSYEAYGVLMQVDKNRTEEILIERLLTGRGINKAAIRKLMLSYKIDISHLFKKYSAQEPKMREAIVRLALLYKNDAAAAAFLDKAAKEEPFVTIRRLIFGARAKEPRSDTVWTIPAFEQMMIDGKTFGAEEFCQSLASDPVFCAIAGDLFFSVYTNNALSNIVIVHNGEVCSLENAPIILKENARVGVLHPLELPASHEYLRRLSVTQPFPQAGRPVFIPGELETASNVVRRLEGTVISAGKLKKNLGDCGFRLLYGAKDNAFTRAAVFMNDCACVLEFSPTGFSAKGQVIILGNARFYHAADFIKVSGKLYIEGVPPIRTSDIPPRMFSEFLYTLYKAGNVGL